jgi:hypothetical protein
MPPFGMSAEMWVYKSTNRCPKCRKMIWKPAISKPDGTRHPTVLLWFQYDKQARATCPRCHQSWNVLATAQTPDAVAVDQIVETARTEELIGDELRNIDNSSTSTSSLRRLRATRRWAQKCDIQIERVSATTNGLTFRLGDLGQYESTIKAAVKRNYAIGTEDEQTFEEEIELTVPPHTMVQLRLRWKRLWQEGYVVLIDQDARTVNIPFRTVIGVTFDQESVDT